MGSQTPNLAIPYPVGTDRLMDGDDAIKAVADRLDALLMQEATLQIANPSTVAIPGGAYGFLTSWTELFKTGAPAVYAATANGKVKVAVAGTYLAVANMQLATNGRPELSIFKNDTIAVGRAIGPLDDGIVSVSAIARLAVNDWFAASLYNGGGATSIPINAATTPNTLTVIRVGP